MPATAASRTLAVGCAVIASSATAATGRPSFARKVPDAGRNDGGGDLDGGDAKRGEHLVGHADRQGAPGRNRIGDRARGLYDEEAVPQSKARQCRLVGPHAGDLIDEGDPGDGDPPPGVEVGHGCPGMGVARELRDYFDEDEDQQDQACDATQHLAPASRGLTQFLPAGRRFRWRSRISYHREEGLLRVQLKCSLAQ